ncbi:hypothetical protein CTI12_AA035360 (chloroplast) [Artemisia annua]|uniref:Uncharacterized protein n=1 Tax=Artemisia annua TaxID=35608 RepID=A0A2U1QFT2_ARTAN|nr:hypothetical protein CTI12_AA035360 [Artemisia annua]
MSLLNLYGWKSSRLQRFGYEVSFEALDKGAIEILGPYECVMTRGRLPGGGGSSVVGKRETRLYEAVNAIISEAQAVARLTSQIASSPPRKKNQRSQVPWASSEVSSQSCAF